MAYEKTEKSTNNAELAQMIANGVSAGIASLKPTKLSYGQYIARQPKKPTLACDCFQNGFQMHPSVLSEEEITLLNQITHSGRYLDRRVEVIVRQDGNDMSKELRYPNRTADQRMEMKSYFRSLTDMLQQIVTLQAQERAADEAKSGRRLEAVA